MGYDVSYHPVDVALVRDRVLPWVLGQGPGSGLDDVVSEGMRIRRIRWRAKAWALGARSFMSGDGPFHYIWGRPLFSTSGRPDEVAEDVVRYLRMSTVDDVDPVAARMVAALSPPGAVTPADPASFPGTDEQLRDEVAGGIRLLRAVVAAVRAGDERVPGLRDDVAPAEYLASRAAFDVLEFVSTLTPGWMDRGRVWPTRLAAAAGVPVPLGFGTPDPLTDQIRAEFPELKWNPYDTIVENYMVGGFVAAADVPVARNRLTEQRGRILAADGHVALSLTKVDEAMALAARLGYAFCEATEIYSGLDGRTN
jgi:hypothetical protein